MPRGKKRTTTHNDDDRQSATAKRQRTGHSLSGGTTFPHNLTQTNSRRSMRSEEIFSQRRCIAWFREYTNAEDPNILGPEGMERFCKDIGVEPENIVMLVLAYKMGATQMGFFSQSEWLRGLTDIECDSVSKMQTKLDPLKAILNDPNVFKSIYRYAYDFAKDSDQRSMDVQTAKAMLQLLLAKHWPLYTLFAQFLDQSKYKVINKDQWCNILEFSRTINNDLSNYDIDGAWPVMLDEFVEWLRQVRQSPQHNVISGNRPVMLDEFVEWLRQVRQSPQHNVISGNRNFDTIS